MQEIIKVMIREFRRIAASPVVFAMVLAGPVMAFVLITVIFKEGVPRDLPVAIVDHDHSALSRKAALMIDASAAAAINKDFTSLAEARNAMEAGKVDAVVYLQQGMQKNILSGSNSEVAVYINNANVIKGSILNSGIQKSLQTLSAGIKLQTRLKSGESGYDAMAKILPVNIHSQVLSNPYLNYSYFITFILMPVMLVLFTLIGTVYAIGNDLYEGTAPSWIRAAGGNIYVALFGKILPYTFMYLMVAAIMNITLFYIIGAPLHGSFLFLLLSELLLIISYQSMAIVLISITANLRLSLSLASAYSMLALTYAGLSYPIYNMPVAGQVFSRIFPLTYWLDAFMGQSLRAAPVADSYYYLLYLVFFILLGFFFIPHLKYICYNNKYWGRL